MLVVVADVVGDHVERSVIRVRLLAGDEFEMLRDEMSSHGMNSHAEERPKQQVEKRLNTEKVKHNRIKRQLYDPVEHFILVHWLRAHEHGTEAVEDGREHAE